MIVIPSDETARSLCFDDSFYKDWESVFKDPSTSTRYLLKFEQLYNDLVSYGHEKCRAMNPKKFDSVAGSKSSLLKIDIVKKPVNLRIIYYFDKLAKKYVFLHCFHKQNNTDYKLAISKAENRLKILLRGE